jgi:hypothetical protein
MILTMLSRRRISLVLILVIPVAFLGVVELTSSEISLPFVLGSLSQSPILQIPEKAISHIFFAIATVGFLASFISLNLIQSKITTGKRLVICGYHPTELLLATFLGGVVLFILIGIYVAFLTRLFVDINHFVALIIGLILIGFVYGSYGLLIGSLVKGELEGILCILLLVNIDAGWLQNPVFYAQAENQFIIRTLPAYYPSQTSVIAAFSDYSSFGAVVNSLLYGLILFALAMIIFYYKLRIKR